MAIAAASAAFLLAGCSGEAQEQKAPPPPLVQVYEVGADDQTVVRHFVARVDALSTVDLSFQVAGRINQLADRQGVVVPEGELLAALDPQDYELALKQSEASFRKAKSDFERGKQLQNDNYISQSEFDALETAYENAELAVENAGINIGIDQGFHGTDQRFFFRCDCKLVPIAELIHCFFECFEFAYDVRGLRLECNVLFAKLFINTAGAAYLTTICSNISFANKFRDFAN